MSCHSRGFDSNAIGMTTAKYELTTFSELVAFQSFKFWRIKDTKRENKVLFNFGYDNLSLWGMQFKIFGHFVDV